MTSSREENAPQPNWLQGTKSKSMADEEDHAPLYNGVYAIVEHEARRVGFDVVSARPAFQAAGMQNLALLRGRHPDPLHPNAAAHEMLARLLYDQLFAADAP
ncbi:MAG: hypothetical protein OEN01_13035 [Candidatus Krumholzibacteria bacterium]|nr:hypothetical protein [Candidatus Krumholzibacteria bacterium]